MNGGMKANARQKSSPQTLPSELPQRSEQTATLTCTQGFTALSNPQSKPEEVEAVISPPLKGKHQRPRMVSDLARTPQVEVMSLNLNEVSLSLGTWLQHIHRSTPSVGISLGTSLGESRDLSSQEQS